MAKRKLCPVLGKYTYDTAQAARRSLARVRSDRAERTSERRRDVECGIFRCPYCLEFHLTHQRQRRDGRTWKDYQ